MKTKIGERERKRGEKEKLEISLSFVRVTRGSTRGAKASMSPTTLTLLLVGVWAMLSQTISLSSTHSPTEKRVQAGKKEEKSSWENRYVSEQQANRARVREKCEVNLRWSQLRAIKADISSLFFSLLQKLHSHHSFVVILQLLSRPVSKLHCNEQTLSHYKKFFRGSVINHVCNSVRLFNQNYDCRCSRAKILKAKIHVNIRGNWM